ncbi:MAG: tryptophan synthase subunit alpha [Verrucomicrobiales bacterium]
MPNRIDQIFQRLRGEKKAAFVAYICAGDPSLEASLDLAAALEEAGVDLLELGIPFSDPLADGVVNQMAAQRALQSGTTTARVLNLVREIRKRSELPLVLFTYLNPVYAFGFGQFHADAFQAGADGILLLDLPPDEALHSGDLNASGGLKQIRLIAPTTPTERMKQIAAQSEGFIYYVSREGVTGAQQTLASNIAQQVAIIKSASEVPVCVGFGISTPEQAASVARVADGVVVGSAIVKKIEEHRCEPDLALRVGGFVKRLVSATKSV